MGMGSRGAKRNRWRLLALVLCGGLLVLLSGLLQPAASQTNPGESSGAEIRGVWMTSNDMATLRDRSKMKAAVDQLAQLNFNTIYPVIWNGGYAYYPSNVTQERRIQSFTFRGLDGQDILAELIQEAHARGLLVVPWFEFGFMAPPTSELAVLHPTWLTQKRDGGRTSISAAGEVVWLNPLRPDVQDFITDLVLEAVMQYDGDGIQFDDHMSLPSEFGYDRFTTDLYRKETGKDVPADPVNPAWVKWRADKITAFMAKLQKEVAAKKKDAIFSISPNYYDFAYKLQLQDWLTWVRRGIADELIVQVYRPDLETFLPQLIRAELQETRRRIPTAVAIMTGQRTRPVPIDLIQSQVQAARQQGLGVAFFYYETLWQAASEPVALRQEALQALFRAPARRSIPSPAPTPSPAAAPAGQPPPTGGPALPPAPPPLP